MSPLEIIELDSLPMVASNEELQRRVEKLVEIVGVLSDRLYALDGRVLAYKATTEGNKLTSFKLS